MDLTTRGALLDEVRLLEGAAWITAPRALSQFPRVPPRVPANGVPARRPAPTRAQVLEPVARTASASRARVRLDRAAARRSG